jgi:hypothetical protein
MAPKQRMRFANEKASKNVILRGNVPKSSVSSPDHIASLWSPKCVRFAEATKRELARRTHDPGLVHIRRVWIGDFPDHPVHPYGVG